MLCRSGLDREVYDLSDSYTSDAFMRTHIVIDDELMDEALRLTGAGTKREVVELGLRTLVRLKRQERIRSARGALEWEGDLDRMRRQS
jgi:Arc/MetJ family transcription regulator